MSIEETPMVSICMITYNHESFVEEAIESVLRQRADFKIELIIGEDISTDNTRSICEKYAKDYPSIIKLLPSEKNNGALWNFARTFMSCSGKYIALLEGDDYWTDPLKLQKQVDFLEKDTTYSFSAHRGLNYLTFSGEFIEEPLFNEVITFRDFAVHRCMIHTMSVVVRNSNEIRDLFKQSWILSLSGADLLLYFSLTRNDNPAYCFNDVMGVYRIHESGTWQSLKPIVRVRKAESDLELYKKNLNLEKGKNELLDWQLKGIIVGKLRELMKNYPILIQRCIIFFVNRVLFISGPGRISSTIGNKINNLISYPDNF